MKSSRSPNKISLKGLFLSAAILGATTASAATLTWDIAPGTVGTGDAAITGGSGIWDTQLGNWTSDAGATDAAWINANVDSAIFQGTAGTVALGEAITANSLTFSTAGYIVSGNTLTLAGTTPTITNTVAATINSVITGTAGLGKSGSGTLTLGAVNTYTGATTITAGKLVLSVDHAVSSSSALVFSSGTATGTLGTLDIGSTSQTFSGLTVSYNPNSTTGATAVVTGTGTLTIAGTTDFSVLNSTTNTPGATAYPVTLNLSGLSNFIYNSASNKVTVGGSGNARSGILTLGANSTFTASSFELQNGGAGTNTAKTSIINLGQQTTINAGTVYVLNSNTKDSATLRFNTGLTAGPSLTIRATDGTGRAAFNVATALTGSGTGLVDLTSNVTGASNLDAMISTLTLGSTSSGTVNASFLMGEGTLDATTILLGSSTGGTALNSTFSVTRGSGLATVKVGTLTFGNRTAGALTSVFNLNGGATLAAQTVQAGTGTATRNFNWNDGTVKNYDASTDLTIGTGIAMTLASASTHAFAIDSGRAGSVGSVIAGSGALTVSGAGTLTLAGANTYTGGTIISAGVTNITGAIVNGATGGISIASGASLAITGTLNLTSTSATIANDGVFTAGGMLNLGSFFDSYSGSTYNLITGAGSKSGTFTVTGYSTSAFSNVAYDGVSGVLTFTAVPEPSIYGLIGAGALASVAFVRRRRNAR